MTILTDDPVSYVDAYWISADGELLSAAPGGYGTNYGYDYGYEQYGPSPIRPVDVTYLLAEYRRTLVNMKTGSP